MAPTGRTYSPYELDRFQTCPRLWDCSRRWEADERWSVNKILGIVVAEGLAALRQGKSQAVAETVAADSLRKWYEPNEEWTFEGVLKHVIKGMKLGMSTNLGLKTIISADQKKYGRCRPDVVGRTPGGRLRVVDDKVKLKLDLKYLSETLGEYQHSNQVYEYAHEVGRYYQEPVYSVGINLIILSPKPEGHFYPIAMNQKVVEMWAAGAEQDFAEMEMIEQGEMKARPRWTSCRTRYNKPGSTEKMLCPMWALCHDLGGDESKADALYKRR